MQQLRPEISLTSSHTAILDQWTGHRTRDIFVFALVWVGERENMTIRFL